ncbi:MAG: histidine triad nucleotide-binding protein [Candidatus Doudnabacteria bacterium]|nr:histidine triad nucleotide-binding protein [Candidatus Doudnabacteria bacterium]
MDTEADDCVFCNITQHKIPAKIYFENEELVVVQDILPKAPVHVLVISKEHVPSINDTTKAHEALLGRMILAGKQAATDRGVGESGYRLTFNVGREGGQIVPHIHLHVLGGKQLAE